MTLRYIIAFILTVLLLAFARRMSTRHEMTITEQPEGITITHKTITENFGDGPVLDVKVSPPEGLLSSPDGRYRCHRCDLVTRRGMAKGDDQ